MTDSLIPWWRTDLGQDEISRIAESIRDRHVTQGVVTEGLEQALARYLDVPYVLLTTNGAVGLLMALIACGVGPGDEVIVPGLTFIATAHAPLLLRAGVKLVDVEAERPLIDADRIEAAIGDRTRVIMAVHLNGRAADLTRINRIAEAHGLLVVEDAAQALGSRNRDGCLGTRSHIGCFSLGITKLITTGEGGVLATRSEEVYARLKTMRNNGVTSLVEGRFASWGFNFRFNDILAAMGTAQMEKIDARMDAIRKVYGFYRTELAGLRFLKLIDVDVDAGELPLWVEVKCIDRDRVVALLGERGVEARPFFPALCDSPHLQGGDDCAQSRRYAAHGMILPSGPDQTMEDLERTIAALQEIDGRLDGEIDSVWPGRPVDSNRGAE